MVETYKNIVGYEGIYQISNYGEIKNIKTGKVLKHDKQNKYDCIKLRKEGKTKMFYIHRLIAIAFIENPENLPCVNHKDEDRKNNNIENLEWCTYKYNSNYGTFPQKVADRRSKATIQKTKDGNVIKLFKSAYQAERETGINNANISECIHGNRKYAGGFIWERGI